MTIFFDVNNVINARDGAQQAFALKEEMIARGWTVVGSGDGISDSAVGSDVITNGDSGQFGFDNTRAWICLQQPAGGSGDFAGTRQFMFQRGDDGSDVATNWRNIYSFAGTANTGAIDANTSPTFSAADESFLAGSGTPASPGFTVTIESVDQTAKLQVLTGNAADNFMFLMQCFANSGSVRTHSAWCFDPLSEVTPGDTDPYAMYTTAFAGGMIDAQMDGASLGKAIVDPDNIGSGVDQIAVIHHMKGWPNASGAMRENHITNKDDLIRPYYASASTLQGFKGVSTIWRYRTVDHVLATTYTVDTNRDRILNDDFVSEWNGSVPL